MIRCKSISGEQAVLYKKFHLPFEKGITLITGENGTGKSLVCSFIPTMIYLEPPNSSRRGIAKQYHEKGSRTIFQFSKDGDEYQYQQFLHGQSVQYNCIKNGKELKHKGQTSGLNYVQAHFPIKEDQFYTTNYLGVDRATKLLVGSPTERYKLLDSIFDLSVYDNLKNHFDSKISSVKNATIQKKALEDSVKDLDKVDESLIPKLKKSLKKLDSRLKHQTKTLNKLQREKIKIEANLEARNNLKTPYGKEEIDVYLPAAIKRLKSQKIKLDDNDRIQSTYDTWYKLNIVLQSLKVKSVSEINEEIKSLTTKKLKMEKLCKPIDKVGNSINIYKKYAENPPNKPLKNVEYLRSKIDYLEETIESLQSIIGEKCCPTCKTQISRDGTKKLICSMESQLDGYRKSIPEAETYSKWIKALDEMVQTFNTTKSKLPQLLLESEKACDRIKFIDSKISKLEDTLHDAHKKELVLQRLEDLNYKREIPKTTKELRRLKKEVEELEQYVDDLKSDKNLLSIIEKNEDFRDVDQLSKDHKSISSNIASINLDKNKTQALLIEVATSINSKSSTLKQLRVVEETLDQLDKSLRDADILLLIQAALGPKGVKQKHLANILSVYIDTLNDYAPTLYQKSINFSCTVKNGGVYIEAERNGKPPTDVALLSGAEKKFFSMLSALALLQLIPEYRRMDTIILDEMEANLSKPSRKKFLNEFLPMLTKVYDKVVLITPQNSEVFPVPADHRYEIHHKDGESKLVKK